jgi:subtilisin family serine protease
VEASGWRGTVRGAAALVLAGAVAATAVHAAAAAPRTPAVRLGGALRGRGPSSPVQVYVRVAEAPPRALVAAGLQVERANGDLGLVQGWIAAGRVAALAAVPGVVAVRPADRARVRAVVSEGDDAAHAPRVRALGFDGTGVVVGVLSDGIDSVPAVAAAGELPAVGVPADPRCPAGAGDEGTAILEIIHDLAPGATLLFAGPATSLEFIDAARCLADAGARVIVDDLGFYHEPYFEDGPVARAVRDIVARGVVWVSAAGNDALQHVDGSFRATACPDLYDFGAGCTDRVLVAPGDALECVLQWNDPFGGAGDDYDLLLVDESLATIAAGADPQTGVDDPIETIVWANDGPVEQVLGLRIRRTHGTTRRVKLFCAGGYLERAVARGSIFGHPGVREVIAVGALDVGDSLLRTVEPFSSRGPTDLFFPVETRPKPDLAGFDGVTVTAAGFAPFYGTSAAAPHVAAVAALVLSKNPFLPPARVQQILTGAATDVAPPGADDATGAGRLDALAALDATPAPECRTDADCEATGCLLDACGAGACAGSAVRGLGAGACVPHAVPPAVARRFGAACRAATRAAAAATPARAARQARRAATALAAAGRAVARARRRGLAAACADDVDRHLADARRRLGDVPVRR